MLEKAQRILIIRLSAIGDVVRVLPALHLLREEYPEAKIDWAVERKSADVVIGHPSVDEVLVFERPAGWREGVRAFWDFCRMVRGRRYDLVVDFHGILKSGLIMGFSGARKRYSFGPPRAQEFSHFFANHRFRLTSTHLNRVEENLALCESVTGRSRWPNVLIYVPHDIQESVDRYFDETFDSGKLVVAMHIPVERPEKQWPPAHFARLTDLLLADGRFEVVLTAGPRQDALVQEVLRRAKRRPFVAPVTPDLKHYAWLAHRSALYVGGDTGPMHIASVMGTPVVAIFGGTDPRQHAPFRPPYEVLHVAEPTGKSLYAAQQRLANVTPEMVYDACVRLVTQQRRAQR